MEPDVLNEVCAKADAARIAQAQLAQTNTQRKNELLNAIADALDARANEIAEANAIDMQKSAEHGMDAGKLDRLKFDVPRVNAAAQGVRHVATLQDPIVKSCADTTSTTVCDSNKPACPSACSA